LRQQIMILSPAVTGLDKPTLAKTGHKILGDKIFQTWSCYSDGIKVKNDYLHCGLCESCINRKNAFITAQIRDKTQYATNKHIKNDNNKAK